MRSLLLQDWVTVGGNGASGVAQEQAGWLDMAPYQDAYFYLDVREVNSGAATLTMNYETSPVEDDTYFFVMKSRTMGISTSVFVDDGGMGVAGVALARWLRWRVSVSVATAWDATFRIWVAASSPGM